MKRFSICAFALVGLACSSSGTATNASGTGGKTTAIGTGGDGVANTSTEVGKGGGPAGVGGSGGTSSAGGEKAGGTSGTAGAGGAVGTGGRVVVDGGARPDGRANPGVDSGTVESTGGMSAGAGGRTGAGGGTASGGTGAGGFVTGPSPVDVTAATAGLPAYYISPTGDDAKSGTSPAEAWQTVKNIPKDKAATVYFEKGGTYTAAGAPAKGRDGPSAFTMVKGSVWTSYGTGDKRPILAATEQTAGKPTGGVLIPGGNNVLAGLSFTGRANFALLLQSDNNVVQDCEIDGNIKDSLIQLGFSVRGHHNLIVGNYIHSLHEVILDNGSVNTSGGAEAIVVNGTDHEIAYNTIDDCWTPNETLGGAEGGCLEVIARAPGEVVENVTFHHNLCTHSVGLFEACAGNFAGTSERVQEHRAVLRNTTLAYNVVIDAMWLYLLQTVNTDMDNLVFEHNTLVHGPANTDIPQQGAAGFGNFYDTDMWVTAAGMTPAPKTCSTAADCGNSFAACVGGNCAYQAKAQPGQIKVRNNLFVVLDGAKAATMKLPPGPDDVVANIFAPKAPSGVTASAGKITIVTDAGLVKDSYKLTASSPAVDKGDTSAVKPWPDFDGKAVPCGDGPDIGASEFCP
jgi:hypothetical protein